MTMPRQASFPAADGEVVTLAAVENTVPLARRLASEIGRQWHLPPSLITDHELVVTELTTNALNATHTFNEARRLNEVGKIKLKFRWLAPRLFTEVWDINPLLPVRKEPSLADVSGRGLEILDYLCRRWAAQLCQQGGKIVWTEQVLSSSSPQ